MNWTLLSIVLFHFRPLIGIPLLPHDEANVWHHSELERIAGSYLAESSNYNTDADGSQVLYPQPYFNPSITSAETYVPPHDVWHSESSSTNFLHDYQHFPLYDYQHYPVSNHANFPLNYHEHFSLNHQHIPQDIATSSLESKSFFRLPDQASAVHAPPAPDPLQLDRERIIFSVVESSLVAKRYNEPVSNHPKDDDYLDRSLQKHLYDQDRDHQSFNIKSSQECFYPYLPLEIFGFIATLKFPSLSSERLTLMPDLKYDRIQQFYLDFYSYQCSSQQLDQASLRNSQGLRQAIKLSQDSPQLSQAIKDIVMDLCHRNSAFILVFSFTKRLNDAKKNFDTPAHRKAQENLVFWSLDSIFGSINRSFDSRSSGQTTASSSSLESLLLEYLTYFTSKMQDPNYIDPTVEMTFHVKNSQTSINEKKINLLRTQLVMNILRQYYKSTNLQKWKSLFDEDDNFILFYHLISRQEISTYQIRIQNTSKNLSELKIFPWEAESISNLKILFRNTNLANIIQKRRMSIVKFCF